MRLVRDSSTGPPWSGGSSGMLLGSGPSGGCSAIEGVDYTEKAAPRRASSPGLVVHRPEAPMNAERDAGAPRNAEALGRRLDGRHVCSLLALGTFDDLELDRLALGESLESLSLDSGVVHEHILAARLLNEPESFGLIEPFHGATLTHCFTSSRIRVPETKRPKRPPHDDDRAHTSRERGSDAENALSSVLLIFLGECFSVSTPIDALNLAACHR